MGYSLIENLETLHESKEAFLEKLDSILPNPSGLTIHDSWDTIGTFITNILVDNQIFPPEVIEELERLLGNNLQKTIQVTATKIKPYTFYGESSLVAIIAQNATNIGQYAFNNCTNLKLANIQAATSIGGYAFYNDNNLLTVGLESAVNVGEYAFTGCQKLEHIDFSKINYINNYAFQNCYKINNLDLSNCTFIGNYAFNGCSNIGPTLYLDNSGNIYPYAFQACSNIEEIIITNKTKTLKEYSLYDIGSKVKRILCEYPSKPSTWHQYWNHSNYPVYWNAEIKDWVFVYNNDKPNSTLTTRIIDEFPDEGEKDGYSFDGWYTDSTLETKCELPYTSPEAFPVLYAKWLIEINIITYNTDTLEWNDFGAFALSSLETINKLRLGVTIEDICMDSEFSIPLTDMTQLSPGCNVYVRGETSLIYDFEYSGNLETVNLAPGAYKLECWGAQGGNDSYNPTTIFGGRGGYSAGIINIAETKKLYIFVGGQGYGSSASSWGSSGGGGASDISVYSDENNWDNSAHFYSRLLVAGGGGGRHGKNYEKAVYAGNDGGGTVAPSFTRESTTITGASQTSGGNTTYSTKKIGSFGKGNWLGQTNAYSRGGFNGGAAGCDGWACGGPGGGWYGGCASWPCGGGGSGWVYTEESYTNWANNSTEGQSGQWLLDAGYYLFNTEIKAGNETFLSPDGVEEIGHSGNGYIRITKWKN